MAQQVYARPRLPFGSGATALATPVGQVYASTKRAAGGMSGPFPFLFLFIFAVSFGLEEATAKTPGHSASAALATPLAAGPAVETSAARWVWPAGRGEVSRAFESPADKYSAGHRGIDLPASVGEEVVAPAAGVVLFAGVVVDRGVLSIRHVDGTVSSIEPISASVSAGDVVTSGQSVGRVSEGGHCDAACLHVGARVKGEYVDPEPYFVLRRRAVLVPLGDFASP